MSNNGHTLAGHISPEQLAEFTEKGLPFTPRLPVHHINPQQKPFKVKTFSLGEDVVPDRGELYTGRGL